MPLATLFSLEPQQLLHKIMEISGGTGQVTRCGLAQRLSGLKVSVLGAGHPEGGEVGVQIGALLVPYTGLL
mgnify:CR=1 FL=1